VIVVDSSVWIAYFRAADIAATRKLDALDLDVGLLVGDIVLLEVLRGARNSAQARQIEHELHRFDIAPMLGERLAVKAAENYRFLRGLGITIRASANLIIGTYCIEHGHVLLHDDRDFDPMREHLGLQVL
jgi:predicted nucleic acid-binding protein